MKKTIASLAILTAASGAHAIVGPGPAVSPKPVTVCLEIYDQSEKDGSITVASCDISAENKKFSRPKLENGCAEGQVAIQTNVLKNKIAQCPTFAQL